MLGNILGSVIKVVTLPIDVVDVVLDVADGGDGSKQSRSRGDNFITEIRDGVVEAVQEIDK
tara:strand:- start:1153 stop:1335 length:183 start_codon:yes stop_codon:yes gene_type:complete